MTKNQTNESTNDQTERLQKILSRAGVASRRKAEEMILAGRVTVNGETVRELGAKFVADMCEIRVDGKVLQRENFRYYLLNKPGGVISAASDDRNRRTVIDLFEEKERLYPVGRLDCDTEGLLLVTNDGDLTNALLHPRHNIDKTYVARVKGAVSPESLDKLRRGVLLDGENRPTAPAKVKILRLSERETVAELTIHEGRNRQIRRMFAAVGHNTIALRRTVFAGLTLDGVPSGEYRSLTAEEVAALYRLAGLKS